MHKVWARALAWQSVLGNFKLSMHPAEHRSAGTSAGWLCSGSKVTQVSWGMWCSFGGAGVVMKILGAWVAACAVLWIVLTLVLHWCCTYSTVFRLTCLVIFLTSCFPHPASTCQHELWHSHAEWQLLSQPCQVQRPALPTAANHPDVVLCNLLLCADPHGALCIL